MQFKTSSYWDGIKRGKRQGVESIICFKEKLNNKIILKYNKDKVTCFNISWKNELQYLLFLFRN